MRATTDRTIRIPAQFAMIPVARQGIAALLAGAPRAADAVLVAHELIVDAVRHSHGTVKVQITHTNGTRIEVHDQRRHCPREALLPTDDNAPDPIAVISRVADELGSSGTRGTYVTTWAVLYDPTPTDGDDGASDGIDDSTETNHATAA